MKNFAKTINDYAVSEEMKNNKERLSFLSHISHGIRTPLNSIMGFSKLLARKKVIDPKQEEYIKGILNGSNLLLQFVQNIMDLSQFEANNYSLRVENYDINQILWDFTEEYYLNKNENYNTNINLLPVWEHKANEFNFETDAELFKKALQRMINLFIVKFPSMDIELGYRVEDNSLLVIYVRPSKECLTPERILHEDQFFLIDENDSFDFFNYKVLDKSVDLLRGDVTVNLKNQEFIMKIPTSYIHRNHYNFI